MRGPERYIVMRSEDRTTRNSSTYAPCGPDHPPPGDVLLIALGVTAVSTSAPLIRAAAAPAFAIAFWRNAMAAGVLAPYTLARARDEVRALSGRDRRLA